MGRWSHCECAEISGTIADTDSAIIEPADNKGNERFTWKKTTPATGECAAGVYAGWFSCEVTWVDLPIRSITGPVSFTLEQSPSGEWLLIGDGTLTGQADFGMEFAASLSGSLDCSTDTFQAQLWNGIYGLPGLMLGSFLGTLEALLDRPRQTLTGTWSLYGELHPTVPCVGPWSAARQP